jgi:hypothetical protein
MMLHWSSRTARRFLYNREELRRNNYGNTIKA